MVDFIGLASDAIRRMSADRAAARSFGCIVSTKLVETHCPNRSFEGKRDLAGGRFAFHPSVHRGQIAREGRRRMQAQDLIAELEAQTGKSRFGAQSKNSGFGVLNVIRGGNRSANGPRTPRRAVLDFSSEMCSVSVGVETRTELYPSAD